MNRTLGCALLVLVVAGFVSAQERKFEPVGIGGGGGMYTPLGSPADPNFRLMSCDMSGAYRSLDAGKTFEMMNWAEMRSCHTCRPCFVGDDVYWARGVRDLRVSRDKAATWQDVTLSSNAPWKGDSIEYIAALDTTPRTLFVGTPKALYVSADEGKAWAKAGVEGGCTALATVGANVYAAFGGKLHASRDSGKTWTALTVSERNNPVVAVAGAADKAKASVLFAVVSKTGILSSTDEGKTWRLSDEWQNQNDVLVPAGQTQVAWAASTKEVWRTLDGGQAWDRCFQMGRNVKPSFVQTELHWGYSIMRFGLGVAADAKTAMVSTQGDFYVTNDSGATWTQHMSTVVGVQRGDPGFRYASKGLEVTSTWRYYIDPNEPDRHYICYTDIGFARSVDAGKTWISSVTGSPWSNTFYDLAFDPFVKGKIYAACSNRHDIPHWTQTDANRGSGGGVCVSEDFGRTWAPMAGLPKLPCTSICLDPKSTEGKVTLYCTLYEGGVYKSTDGGRTWDKKSKGLGNPGNLHALLVRVHPKTGSLFCAITAMREGASDFRIPGGLWKSTDGGDSWQCIDADLKLVWANGFAVDPDDENVIYQTAATAPGKNQGGLYKTTDGGKTWTRPLKDADFGVPFVHALFVTLYPGNPKMVYVGSTSGLRLSKDSGATWEDFTKIPFRCCHIPTFDPKDPTTMWVTTFGGGVWKGSYLPAK